MYCIVLYWNIKVETMFKLIQNYILTFWSDRHKLQCIEFPFGLQKGSVKNGTLNHPILSKDIGKRILVLQILHYHKIKMLVRTKTINTINVLFKVKLELKWLYNECIQKCQYINLLFGRFKQIFYNFLAIFLLGWSYDLLSTVKKKYYS